MKTAPATTLEQWLASIRGHMEADPGYLDTLLHAFGVGKPFLMRLSFSVDVLEGETEA